MSRTKEHYVRPRGTNMAIYTIHFQKYPTPPGPSYGIKALIGRLTSDDTIVLLGNPTGFEDDILSIKAACIGLDDQTAVVSSAN